MKEALAVDRVFAVVIGMMMMMKKLRRAAIMRLITGENLHLTYTLLTHSWDPSRH